jgi:hypothetical protein
MLTSLGLSILMPAVYAGSVINDYSYLLDGSSMQRMSLSGYGDASASIPPAGTSFFSMKDLISSLKPFTPLTPAELSYGGDWKGMQLYPDSNVFGASPTSNSNFGTWSSMDYEQDVTASGIITGFDYGASYN